MAVSRRKYAAFTLVELLVVITILGVLMSLLLPAVNTVRESMRRTQCKSNLTNIGRAMAQHLALQGHFPSSGWGYKWVGDPDYGFSDMQPGGWAYNLLPYFGLDMIHDIGKGMAGPGPGTAKYNALAEAKSAAIPILICPTRRKPIAYPQIETSFNAAQPTKLNKTDYAANGGSKRFLGQGPVTLDCLGKLRTCTTWDISADQGYSNQPTQFTCNLVDQYFNGISGVLSQTTPGAVSDGLSNVLFAGEKYLNPQLYYTGQDGADNNSALQGNDWDTNRWVANDFSATSLPPMRDTVGVETCSMRFGSAHSQGCNFVFCDGSVRLISYTVDYPTFKSLGVRNDGTLSDNY